MRRVLLALCVAASTVEAQRNVPHDSVIVSLITMGQGSEVFERFGHNAIRVHNLRTGFDLSYNWGTFSFDEPHFIQRFLTGETNYWVQAIPSEPMFAYYREQHRSVFEQELHLTPAEKDSLTRFIVWNSSDEHKFYRYDYYRDNCSTRVRDALDHALGGALKRASLARANGVSYRSETLRLANSFPLINFGMDFVLGSRADSTLSGWEEAFIPMRLRDIVHDALRTAPDGATSPVVLRETVIVADSTFTEATAAPKYLVAGLLAGIALGALLVALSFATGAAGRGTLGVLASAIHGLLGVLGLLLLLAGSVTRHVYMGHNVNVLVASPLSFIPMVLIPLAFRLNARERMRKQARDFSYLLLAAALISLVVRLVRGEMHGGISALAFALPLHASLSFAVYRVTTSLRTRAA